MPRPRAAIRRGSILEGRYAVWAVEAAYVALLGFLAGKLIYTLIEPLSTPFVAPTVAEREITADTSIFQRYNPFTSAPVTTGQSAAYDDVEETRLSLTLVGTFVTGDQPSATIQTDGGGQKLFFIGDEVVAGTSITDILPDQVILSRRGVRETLSLKGRENMIASQDRSTKGAAIGSIGAPSSLISRFIRMSPARDGKGVEVRAGSEPLLFDRAGLLDGDIVIAANGRALPSDLNQAQSMLLRQMSRGPVTATIMRSGVTLDIVIDPSGLKP
ncbi:MAG: type II secretion system protein N [Parvularcula sp.]